MTADWASPILGVARNGAFPSSDGPLANGVGNFFSTAVTKLLDSFGRVNEPAGRWLQVTNRTVPIARLKADLKASQSGWPLSLKG
jgi:hypothetical protein